MVRYNKTINCMRHRRSVQKSLNTLFHRGVCTSLKEKALPAIKHVTTLEGSLFDWCLYFYNSFQVLDFERALNSPNTKHQDTNTKILKTESLRTRTLICRWIYMWATFYIQWGSFDKIGTGIIYLKLQFWSDFIWWMN